MTGGGSTDFMDSMNRRWIPLVRKNILELLPEDAYSKVDKRLYFSVTEVGPSSLPSISKGLETHSCV